MQVRERRSRDPDVGSYSQNIFLCFFSMARMAAVQACVVLLSTVAAWHRPFQLENSLLAPKQLGLRRLPVLSKMALPTPEQVAALRSTRLPWLQGRGRGPAAALLREQLADQCRDAGLDNITSPIGVAKLPDAALIFGWPAECFYGARIALAQFVLTWNWPGSAVSLGTGLLLLSLMNHVFQLAALIRPLGWIGAAPLYAFDQIWNYAVAAVISLPLAVVALLGNMGHSQEGLGVFLAIGPRLIRAWQSKVLAAYEEGGGWALWVALCISDPFREELVYRVGLQRGFATGCSWLLGRRESKKQPESSESSRQPNTTDPGLSAMSSARVQLIARLSASLLFGFAHCAGVGYLAETGQLRAVMSTITKIVSCPDSNLTHLA